MSETLRNTPDFTFLGKKIMELKTALFKPEADLLPLPNNIITTSKVDNLGRIWFFTSCQKNITPIYDTPFFATLDYFNKEKNTRISVYGAAKLVAQDSEDAAAFVEGFLAPSVAARQILLVALNIQKADCFNLGMDADDSWLIKLKAGFQNWLYAGSTEKNKLTFDLTK